MFLLIILVFSFVTCFLIFFLITGLGLSNKQIVGARLEKIASQNTRQQESELNEPVFSRIIRPFFDGVSKNILKATPKELISMFEKKIIMAGSPYKLTIKDWINIQVIIIICLPLLTFATGYYKDINSMKMVLTILGEVFLGIFVPILILNSSINSRKKKIINSLPDVLDLLTVSVEAGLGFDGALSKVIDKMPGPLSEEFDNVLKEIKVGKQKRDALKDMSDRVDIQDLTIFINSIIQADQLGVSLGNVFRIQSDQIRQKRKQRAQEKAMKAPVKMLIPMALFIFPTIFSVLIGPVAIKVFRTFMK